MKGYPKWCDRGELRFSKNPQCKLPVRETISQALSEKIFKPSLTEEVQQFNPTAPSSPELSAKSYTPKNKLAP